ncbi:hypothetical protein LTR62_002434 [Meristemomyces frigidus]|uniref:Frequency clock protein n=1 Tax=Meristemomyces frigidus TaxID=1508187 RepID=A0AAN7YHN9_9PEZI|nr:hypothetical protein LTR62_002434 [Meristemomyces frigidus]
MSGNSAPGVMTPSASFHLSHPRRVPAQHSVSLWHGAQPQKSFRERSKSSDGGDVSSWTPSNDSLSSLLHLGQESSGGSSNAQEWFEKSNNAVKELDNTFNQEPPFFMQRDSSSTTPPELQNVTQHYMEIGSGAQSLAFRAGSGDLGAEGSSSKDYRGVIDDLTIENKRLKKRLKRYEKLHDSHMKDEKLFEVRIHGLPPDKKHELEETLRQFASGLGHKGQGSPSIRYEGLMPMLPQHKASSSQFSLPNDSAYASMSASGIAGSSGPSSYTRPRSHKPSAASRQQNIHSFLHHIPEGLLSLANPATMTERAKKKLVVNRLEQIFAGRGATDTGHQQSLQQQEVSQIAARADRSETGAAGIRARQEGLREAQIMSNDHEDAKQELPNELLAAMKSAAARTGEQDFAEKSPSQTTIEQRPTRPLDLDPQRAQVPADNIAYFRNLGFSPPQDSSRTPEEGHGWLYLNLLINMAQLHTICVTVEFVQKALGEYSDRFELSEDGRKVRWKGWRRGHGHRSSENGVTLGEARSDEFDEESPYKRLKISHGAGVVRGNMPASGKALGEASARFRVDSNRLAYTPLFSHWASGDDSEVSCSEEEVDASVLFPARATAESSGLTSSGLRATLTKLKKNRDDGPIIFYNNSRFCTDLSTERMPDGSRNAPTYTTLSSHPIGKPLSARSVFAEKRGPLHTATHLPEPMDIDDNRMPPSMEVYISESPISSSGTSPRKRSLPCDAEDFEVTGMGGVWPADHFRIDVRSRYTRIAEDAQAPKSTNSAQGPLPSRLAKVLQGEHKKNVSGPALHHEVIASQIHILPPAEFPPALYYMPSGETLDEDSSASEEAITISSGSAQAELRLPARQPLGLQPASSDYENQEGSGYGDDDDSVAETDSSVDFLALVRDLDPDSIRAKEREYDAHLAERLAENIPAGSSAATAGGGSGFASPGTAVGRAEYRRARREARVAADQRSIERAVLR